MFGMHSSSKSQPSPSRPQRTFRSDWGLRRSLSILLFLTTAGIFHPHSGVFSSAAKDELVVKALGTRTVTVTISSKTVLPGRTTKTTTATVTDVALVRPTVVLHAVPLAQGGDAEVSYSLVGCYGKPRNDPRTHVLGDGAEVPDGVAAHGVTVESCLEGCAGLVAQGVSDGVPLYAAVEDGE